MAGLTRPFRRLARACLRALASGLRTLAVAVVALTAVIMMILGGGYLAAGLAQFVENHFDVVRDGMAVRLVNSPDPLAWFQVIGGGLLALAGGVLLTGHVFGRLGAMAFAAVVVAWGIYNTSYHPLSLLITVPGLAVISAVAWTRPRVSKTA